MLDSLDMHNQNRSRKIARIYKIMKPMAIPTVGGMTLQNTEQNSLKVAAIVAMAAWHAA